MRKFLIALLAIFALTGFAVAAVDINTADQKALESVKGIGPVKAKAIIDYRTKNGPFKSAEDLDKVKGFGAKSINKMSSELSIDGKPLAPVAETKDSKKGAAASTAPAAPAPAAVPPKAAAAAPAPAPVPPKAAAPAAAAGAAAAPAVVDKKAEAPKAEDKKADAPKSDDGKDKKKSKKEKKEKKDKKEKDAAPTDKDAAKDAGKDAKK